MVHARVFGVMGLLTAAAWAQSTAPAGRGPGGGGGGGGGAVDLSSPRESLVSLYTAMHRGDLAAARACMHFADARQAELFDVNFVQTWGPMKLMRAMEAKFGEAGRRPFANAVLEKPVQRLLERLKTVEFEMDGATASVSEKKAQVNPSAESELTGIALVREEGSWRVVAGTFSDMASDLPDAQLLLMRALKGAVESACAATLTRLERGELPTAEAAYADYQARLQAATRAAGGAGTRGAAR